MIVTTRELLVPALPRSIDDIQTLVQRLWTDDGRVGLTDRIRFECAVVETANTIIEHAAPVLGRSTVTIAVSVTCRHELLRAVLTDDGQPSQVDLSAATPDVAVGSGRGLAIARAASDVLGYERVRNRNSWTVECLRGS